MGKLEKVAGAPVEVEVGGQKYKLSPITIGHLAELEAWAKRQPYADLRAALEEVGGSLTESERAELVKQAQIDASNPEEMQRRMNSIQGILKAFGLSVRVAHPKLDDDKVAEIVTALGAEQAGALVDEVSGLDEDERKK